MFVIDERILHCTQFNYFKFLFTATHLLLQNFSYLRLYITNEKLENHEQLMPLGTQQSLSEQISRLRSSEKAYLYTNSLFAFSSKA